MAALSTLSLIGIGLTAAKTGADFVAQRKQAKLAEQQGNFEAMLFGRNADQAELQAADAVARGREGEMDVVRNQRLLEGDQRTAFAAQGIDVSTGSPAAVIENDSALAQIDRQRIRINAAREAHGFQFDADTYRMEGEFARQAGRNQAKALRNQSVVTLLSGAADMASAYRNAPRRIKRSPVPRTGGGGYGAGEESPY